MSDDSDAREVVGCGLALEGSVEIADPESDDVLSDGGVGEICVQGPSVAYGYWQNSDESQRVFGATLRGRAGCYLRTGDLGFKLRGELFITGRAKDLVILRGRNHYPQDIEATVLASHAAFSPAGAAAFSVERDREEVLVIVAAVDRRKQPDLAQIVRAARDAITAEHEVSLHELVLVDPSQLPKTSSGKIRRSACREAYESGALKLLASSRSQRPPEPIRALLWDWREKVPDAPTLPFGRGAWVFVGPDQELNRGLITLLRKRGDQCLSVALESSDLLQQVGTFIKASRCAWRGLLFSGDALDPAVLSSLGEPSRVRQLIALCKPETKVWCIARRAELGGEAVDGVACFPASLPDDFANVRARMTYLELPRTPVSKEVARVHQELWAAAPEDRIRFDGSKRYVWRLNAAPELEVAEACANACIVWMGDPSRLDALAAHNHSRADEGGPRSVYFDPEQTDPERFAADLRQQNMTPLALVFVGSKETHAGAQLCRHLGAPVLAWCQPHAGSAATELDWLAPLVLRGREFGTKTWLQLDVTLLENAGYRLAIQTALAAAAQRVAGGVCALSTASCVASFAPAHRAFELLLSDAESCVPVSARPGRIERTSKPPSAVPETRSSNPPPQSGAVPQSSATGTKLEQADDPKRDSFQGIDSDAQLEALRRYVAQLVSRALGNEPHEIDLSVRLTDVGLDSMQMTELRTVLEKRLRIRIPMAALIDGPSGDQLARLVSGLMNLVQERSA